MALPERPARTVISDAVRVEIEQLGVGESYESALTLGIAGQLDREPVGGAAYAALSRELDRRVDLLRVRALAKNGDATASSRASVAEKRLRLV